MHEEDGAIPVDPFNIRVLCESIEFFHRERHVADVVELSNVVDDKKKGGEEATLEELWADPPEMQNRCGNRNGLYVVDFATIGNHRQALIAAGKGLGDMGEGSDDGLLCMPVLESEE